MQMVNKINKIREIKISNSSKEVYCRLLSSCNNQSQWVLNRAQRSSPPTGKDKQFYLISSEKQDQNFPKPLRFTRVIPQNRQKYSYQMRTASPLNYQRYFNLRSSQMQNESNVFGPKFTQPQLHKLASTSQEDNQFLFNNEQYAQVYPQYWQIMQMSRNNPTRIDRIHSSYQFLAPLKIPLPSQYYRSATSFQDQPLIDQEDLERDYHQYWQMMQKSRHNRIRDNTGIIMVYHNHQAAQLRRMHQRGAQRFS